MKEYFTEAIVLDKEPSGEYDVRVHLYTKELGRVVAKATSARKITSKLNAHLEPLNLVDVRMVNKNSFQIVDALRKNKISPNFLNIVKATKELTAENDFDYSLWTVLTALIQKNQPNMGVVLSVLGFDPKFANCEMCGGDCHFFSLINQGFYCKNCVKGSFNIDSKDSLCFISI